MEVAATLVVFLLCAGTGLGLYICLQLTHLMGGKMWVESQEGVGSTFYLQLPMQKAPSSPHCKFVKDGNVLVVDANQTLLHALTKKVEACGYSPVVCDNIGDAAAALKTAKSTFRCVLVDSKLAAGLLDKLQEEAIPISCQTVLMGCCKTAVPPALQKYEFIRKPIRQQTLQNTLQKSIGRTPLTTPPKTAQLKILLVEDNEINQKVLRSR